MASSQAISGFHPIVRSWFEGTYGTPTPPQELGWPHIAAGHNTLILAPTGSGKTLAAFLWAINHVVESHLREQPAGRKGVRILYISPLKALNNDIARNLERPLEGIAGEARRAGLSLPDVRVAVRTGDTPQSDRVKMTKHPPDILITTPESLYLLLTSPLARKMLSTVNFVIVDEIHAVCGNKRGVHLSLSLERLQVIAEQEFVRIGLSATQRPLERIAAFLGGNDPAGTPRRVDIVDAGRRKAMDLSVVCPISDFTLLPADGVWPLILDRLVDDIRSHTTTLVFVNNRRLAERVAARLNELLLVEGRPTAVNLMAVPARMDWSLTTGHGSPATGHGTPSTGHGSPATGHGSPTTDHVRDNPSPPNPSPPPVLAYHGSMSREVREQMESDLKAGKLRVVVATSALELGIDIGSIDLVVQLQSPKGIARGLQRVGRSGHLVSARSSGRIYPSHREDLVECTVVARLMQEHEVEAVTIPRDCLDVLAQQIVAMVAVEDWDVDVLFGVVRQSACYGTLSRELYLSVLHMLAGRYQTGAFRELRPRISWDKVNNILRALPGSARLAITGGGTITDRGQFAVYLQDGRTKVGEVDEEFVYETRVGDTFLLGTTVWRVTDIDTSRLTVAPAPGEPARMPFWRGEGIGRSYELAMRLGEFRRTMSERLESPSTLEWLKERYPVDADAAWNILEYFRRQRDHIGTIPHDRRIVVEGFRDEIGDPRIVIHAPFGRRVNGLLGIIASGRAAHVTGVTPQMLYNDDGILLRSPSAEQLPLDLLQSVSTSHAVSLVLDEITRSALFGGQFRQNASRALLMPRLAPGKRTPLWLQRLHAKDLLEAARNHADFPIVLETMREVLNDILDFEHFKEVISAIQARAIEIATVTTESPSPFAASLLFEFMAVYMYEWDQPKAERSARYAAINRELLAAIVDTDEIPSLVRPEAVSAIEADLQHTHPGSRARSPEELMELLLRLGDLTAGEIAERTEGDAEAMLDSLARDGRARQVEVGGERRWIAGEEAEIYADLVRPEHVRRVLSRHICSHTPVGPEALARRYGLPRDDVETIVRELAGTHTFISGKFVPGPESTQWCYRPTLERIQRQTIAILRREISPCRVPQFARFLRRWQHRSSDTRLRGAEGIQVCLEQLEGLALPADAWERDVLPGRVVDMTPELLRSALSANPYVWVGTGTGRMMPLLRGEAAVFLPPRQGAIRAEVSPAALKIMHHLRTDGALFLADLRTATGLSLASLNSALAELFWNGEITNDVFSEVASLRRSSRQAAVTPLERVQMLGPPRDPARRKVLGAVRRAIRETPGWRGRWTMVSTPAVLGPDPAPEDRIEHQAVQLLARYGIVARELVQREELLPWQLVAEVFHRMELRGELRRGYFVEGLSGMQYALPDAVDELRRPPPVPEFQLLSAVDPANPYGPGIPLPADRLGEAAGRLLRIPSHYVGFAADEPVVLVEGSGAHLWFGDEETAEWVGQLVQELQRLAGPAGASRRTRRLLIETINGDRAAREPWGSLLRGFGFAREMNQAMRWEG